MWAGDQPAAQPGDCGDEGPNGPSRRAMPRAPTTRQSPDTVSHGGVGDKARGLAEEHAAPWATRDAKCWLRRPAGRLDGEESDDFTPRWTGWAPVPGEEGMRWCPRGRCHPPAWRRAATLHHRELYRGRLTGVACERAEGSQQPRAHGLTLSHRDPEPRDDRTITRTAPVMAWNDSDATVEPGS